MADGRPNIILILADDMGLSDIGCYGSEIETPTLDQLAAGGIRFTQAYNCARCCPTRASLLTGLYPHQAGVGHMVNNLGPRPYQGYLRDDCVTIAEALKAGGYRTMLSGKWHVGGIYARNDPDDWTVGDPQRPLPPDRGFDDWHGTPAGAGSYFNPKPLYRNYTLTEPEGDDYHPDFAQKSGGVKWILNVEHRTFTTEVQTTLLRLVKDDQSDPVAAPGLLRFELHMGAARSVGPRPVFHHRKSGVRE